MQNGRFDALFNASRGSLGQGGFGSVYHAVLRDSVVSEVCRAVKVIPVCMHGDDQDALPGLSESWCGVDVFERLLQMRSQHVLRYFGFWLEKSNPLTLSQMPSCQHTNVSLHSTGIGQGISLLPSSCGFEWGSSCHRSGPSSSSKSPPAANAVTSEIVVLLEHMELCDGVSLHSWLKAEKNIAHVQRTRLGVLCVFKELLLGLKDIHTSGIVHRDVKPANMLLEFETGKLRILDFGLVRLAFQMPVSECVAPANQIGTPGYAAPEQCSGSEAHTSADMCSAGVVLVELLVSISSPFVTAMERVIALEELRRPIPVLPAVLRGSPCASLLVRLVSADPSRRPTALEAFYEIETICDFAAT